MMGLFSKGDQNPFTYKGYYVYKDIERGFWYIRKGERYGTIAGTARDKNEAKKVIDGLKS